MPIVLQTQIILDPNDQIAHLADFTGLTPETEYLVSASFLQADTRFTFLGYFDIALTRPPLGVPASQTEVPATISTVPMPASATPPARYPYAIHDRFIASNLNLALDFDPGTAPPNGNGGGAGTYKYWVDTSTPLPTLRQCIAAPRATAGTYVANEWIALGTIDRAAGKFHFNSSVVDIVDPGGGAPSLIVPHLEVRPTDGGEASIVLNKQTTASSIIYGFKAGAGRWAISLGDNAPETGGNTGSNFSVHRYGDAGNYLGAPLSINRASGDAIFSNALVVASNFTAYAYHFSGGYLFASTDGFNVGFNKIHASDSTPALFVGPTHLYYRRESHVFDTPAGVTYMTMSPNVIIAHAVVQLNAGATAAEHATRKDYVDTQDAAVWNNAQTKLPLSGGTLTGQLFISEASPRLILNKGPGGGTNNEIYGTYNSFARWVITLGTAENESTGTNIGTNFAISSFTDAGAYMTSPLSINRASGTVSVNHALSVVGNAVIGGTTTSTGVMYAPFLSGGAGGAGQLRTYNSANTVSFVWAGSNSTLHWRIDDVLQAMICVTENASHFNTGAYGPLSAGLSFREISTGTNYVVYIDQFSDERVKSNIMPSDIDALGLMKQIQVSQFDVAASVTAWLQNSTQDEDTRAQAMAEAKEPVHVDIGLVAQQVQPLIPEAVHVAAQGDVAPDSPLPPDVQSIELQKIVPYLVRAIQQLVTRVETLEGAP